MRTTWFQGRSPAWLIAGVAVAVGCLLPLLPEPAQLFLVLAIAMILISSVTRSWAVLRDSQRSRSPNVTYLSQSPETFDYRLARWLTYLGFAGLALLTLRPTTALTLSDWMFLAALVVAALGYMANSRGMPLMPYRTMLAGVLLVFMGAALSLVDATDAIGSIGVASRFVYLTIAWFALAGLSLRTTRHVSTATTLWVGSVALSGAAAVAQLLWGNVIPGTMIDGGRMTGFAQQVNDLGGMCAVALIPAASLLLEPGLGLVRQLLYAFLLALVFAGLLLSGSVGGFMAAAVGLVMWIWIGGAGRRSLGALFGLICLSAVAAGSAAELGLVLPGARIASVLSSPLDPYATFYSRLEGYFSAWQAIQASPIFGVGFDSVSATEAVTGNLVHNTLIMVWFEGGLIAFLGVILVLLAAARAVWQAWWMSESPASRSLSAALFASAGSAFAFSMTAPVLFQRYAWVPVFLAIALVSHQLRARTSTSHKKVGVGDQVSGERMSAGVAVRRLAE